MSTQLITAYSKNHSPLCVSLSPSIMAWRLCSGRTLAALLVISAFPFALLVALERRKLGGDSFQYRSLGWIRETLKWDDQNHRFLVSTFFDGGVSEILLSGAGGPVETPFLFDPTVAGNGSLGIALDHPRSRLLVVYSDILGNRFSALGAYDLSSRRQLFLSRLSGTLFAAKKIQFSALKYLTRESQEMSSRWRTTWRSTPRVTRS